MAREFDPNNLTGGDVIRALGPLIGVIIALVVVGKYAPQYLWVVFIAIFAFVAYGVHTIPKENLKAIELQRQRTDEKIKNLPFLGPIIYPIWRVTGWLLGLLSFAALLMLVYLLYTGAT